jgi:bla regulator protein blaR1
MTALIEMLIPAVGLSALASVCLALLPNAPSGLRFWIAVAGLAAWVVPWPLIEIAVSFDGGREWWAAPLAHARAAAGSLAVAPPFGGPYPLDFIAWIVGAAFAAGAAWFAVDCVRTRAATRFWRRESLDGETLRTLLPAGLRDTSAEIRVVPDSPFAAASGYFRATIWIGGELRDRDTQAAALLHECWHVRRRDPLRILLLTAVRRVYWWNPLVAKLAAEATLMIEAACDRNCAQELGTPHYVERLAQMMLAAHGGPPPLLTAAAGRRSSNLRRLNLLERETRMRTRDYLLVGALAAGGLALAACRTIEPNDAARAPALTSEFTLLADSFVTAPDGSGWELIGNVRLRPVSQDVVVISSDEIRVTGNTAVLRGNVLVAFELGDIETDELRMSTVDGQPFGTSPLTTSEVVLRTATPSEQIEWRGGGVRNVEMAMDKGRLIDPYR